MNSGSKISYWTLKSCASIGTPFIMNQITRASGTSFVSNCRLNWGGLSKLLEFLTSDKLDRNDGIRIESDYHKYKMPPILQYPTERRIEFEESGAIFDVWRRYFLCESSVLLPPPVGKGWYKLSSIRTPPAADYDIFPLMDAHYPFILHSWPELRRNFGYGGRGLLIHRWWLRFRGVRIEWNCFESQFSFSSICNGWFFWG